MSYVAKLHKIKSELSFEDAFHHWNDTSFDWASLDAAQSFICRYVRRYSFGFVLSSKEKYGTIRYERLIIRPLSWEVNGIVYRYRHRWAKYILIRAVVKACEKYKHIAPEILDDFYIEYL